MSQFYILKDDDIIAAGDQYQVYNGGWCLCYSSLGRINGEYRRELRDPSWEVRRKLIITPLGNSYDN